MIQEIDVATDDFLSMHRSFDATASLVFDLQLPAAAAADLAARSAVRAMRSPQYQYDPVISSCRGVSASFVFPVLLRVSMQVGWERNTKGILAPRILRLGATLDPQQRAASAVDLNLKLMRWCAPRCFHPRERTIGQDC